MREQEEGKGGRLGKRKEGWKGRGKEEREKELRKEGRERGAEGQRPEGEAREAWKVEHMHGDRSPSSGTAGRCQCTGLGMPTSSAVLHLNTGTGPAPNRHFSE